MHVATPPAPCPPSTAHLALSFLHDAHRALAEGLVPGPPPRTSMKPTTAPPAANGCSAWARAAGCATACPPRTAAPLPALDSRALVLLRETLAYHLPLADFAFAMQGLGSGAITLAGSPVQQAHYP